MPKTSTSHIASRLHKVQILLVLSVAALGCDMNPPKAPPGGGNAAGSGLVNPKGKGDPFTLAAADAKPAERPYLEGAKPFLNAVVKRDYAAAFAELSSHARNTTRPFQFVPPKEVEQPPQNQQPLENLTAEQFADWMKKTEERFGAPKALEFPQVWSIDPAVLSGKAGGIDVMFAIGAMPKEIPAEIRKASIRARIDCHFTDEAAKEIAADLNIPLEQAKAGKFPENDQGYDEDTVQYMNVKFVLVEEEGKLKVAYFEFMPPSMLD